MGGPCVAAGNRLKAPAATGCNGSSCKDIRTNESLIDMMYCSSSKQLGTRTSSSQDDVWSFVVDKAAVEDRIVIDDQDLEERAQDNESKEDY